MANTLTYIQGRQLKQPLGESKFLPDYLGTRKPNSKKTLDEQEKEFAVFATKLKSMTGK